MKGKGLEIIGVNPVDPESTVKKYLDEMHLSFKLGKSVRGQRVPNAAYGVRSYPTNFVLDGDGKVAWRAALFDEAAMRKALAALGVK